MSSIKSIFLFISTLHISNRLNIESTVDFKFRVGGGRKQAVGWKGLILVNFFSLMTLSRLNEWRRVCDICISIYIRLDWATFLLLQLLFFNYVVLFKGPETELRWMYQSAVERLTTLISAQPSFLCFIFSLLYFTTKLDWSSFAFSIFFLEYFYWRC